MLWDAIRTKASMKRAIHGDQPPPFVSRGAAVQSLPFLLPAGVSFGFMNPSVQMPRAGLGFDPPFGAEQHRFQLIFRCVVSPTGTL